MAARISQERGAGRRLRSAVDELQRQRRVGRRDPAAELALTRNFGISTAPIPGLDAALRTRPVTFAVAIRSAPAAGVLAAPVFEFGSSANGIRLNQLTDRLEFMAGGGVAAANDGVDVSFVHGVIPDGETRDWRIVGAVSPGNGQIRLWVNGVLRARAKSVAAGLLNGEWADAGGGQMTAVNGTASARLGNPGAITNVVQIQPLTVFFGQLPRQFG